MDDSNMKWEDELRDIVNKDQQEAGLKGYAAGIAELYQGLRAEKLSRYEALSIVNSVVKAQIQMAIQLNKEKDKQEGE